MERIITMSTKELDRAEVLSKLKQKALSQTQAADVLGISCRQVRRLYKGYKEMGLINFYFNYTIKCIALQRIIHFFKVDATN